MLDPLKYSCGLEKELLYRILPAVSRSFYLSLRVAPTKVRRSLGLGYLFCRAADTMADTEILPPELRTHYLTRFREAFDHGGGHFCSELRQNMNDQNSPSAEHRLLQNLDACFMYFDGLEPDDRKQKSRSNADTGNGDGSKAVPLARGRRHYGTSNDG